MEKLLKAHEVSAVLGISRSAVFKLWRRGELPAVRIGRSIRCRPSDLEAYVAGNSTNPTRNPLVVGATNGPSQELRLRMEVTMSDYTSANFPPLIYPKKLASIRISDSMAVLGLMNVLNLSANGVLVLFLGIVRPLSYGFYLWLPPEE